MHTPPPRPGWLDTANPDTAADAADPTGPDQDSLLTAHLDELRRARAGLAWLFEPDAPSLHDLLATHRVTEAFDRLAEPSAIAPADLRREVRHIPAGDLWAAAASAVAGVHRHRARVVIPEDAEWPDGVADSARADRDATAPAALCLWVRGEQPLAATLARSVAVVGARAATQYGVHVAADLGGDLASLGWTVVSTGGYGIDGAAHRGALTTHAHVVAVLSGGIDRPHPAGNLALFDRVAGRGLLVSQWPPGTAPNRDRISTTQRLIAAITRGTVVVEASTRSGALTTVRHAIELGRVVMAVPGPVTSVMSAGCHQLLRECRQVRLVTGSRDVLHELTACGPAATA